MLQGPFELSSFEEFSRIFSIFVSVALLIQIKRKYFVGAAIGLADIALVAYTRFSHEAGIDLAQYPNVQAWVRRVETDLNIEHAA